MNRLRRWTGSPQRLANLLAFFVRVSKQEQRAHVLLATSDAAFTAWLGSLSSGTRAATCCALCYRPLSKQWPFSPCAQRTAHGIRNSSRRITLVTSRRKMHARSSSSTRLRAHRRLLLCWAGGMPPFGRACTRCGYGESTSACAHHAREKRGVLRSSRAARSLLAGVRRKPRRLDARSKAGVRRHTAGMGAGCAHSHLAARVALHEPAPTSDPARRRGARSQQRAPSCRPWPLARCTPRPVHSRALCGGSARPAGRAWRQRRGGGAGGAHQQSGSRRNGGQKYGHSRGTAAGQGAATNLSGAAAPGAAVPAVLACRGVCMGRHAGSSRSRRAARY